MAEGLDLVLTDNAVVAIDAMAVLIIVVGTLEMFVTCVRSVFVAFADRPASCGTAICATRAG